MAPQAGPRETQQFFLQVGAFAHSDTSLAVLNELKQKGYKAQILTTDDYQRMVGGSTNDGYRRVMVGPFKARSEAARTQAELKKQGYHALFRESTGGKRQ